VQCRALQEIIETFIAVFVQQDATDELHMTYLLFVVKFVRGREE
jgi:hypothetical protein